MMRLIAVSLLIVLIGSLPIYGQTINISESDFRMLRVELLTSKQLLETSANEIEILQMNLRQALVSREASEMRIAELEGSLDASEESLQEAERRLTNSDLKIDDLERRLTEALGQQRELQNRINSLGNLLSELYTSLIGTEIDLDESEDRLVSDIQGMVQGYERRLRVYRVLTWIFGSIAVGASTYAFLNQM